ncbi:MAG: F0F1 ATP synthase subunit B [Planctomycetota bacterium]|nr:F0F1 ATP synthase subunit B [Planctomycetota bacterium]
MRTWILTTATVACLVLASATPAFAGEDGGKANLDIFAQVNLPTILTSLGVFVVLLIVLSKTAWKPILAGLKQREDTIRNALDEAEAAHEKAKALIAEYESKIDKAREEAQAIFDEARRDADDIRSQIETDARQRADETVDRAKREIDQLTAKAWDGLVRDAAQIATEAASRIISTQLTPDGHAEIVAGVVSEFATQRGSGAQG